MLTFLRNYNFLLFKCLLQLGGPCIISQNEWIFIFFRIWVRVVSLIKKDEASSCIVASQLEKRLTLVLLEECFSFFSFFFLLFFPSFYSLLFAQHVSSLSSKYLVSSQISEDIHYLKRKLFIMVYRLLHVVHVKHFKVHRRTKSAFPNSSMQKSYVLKSKCFTHRSIWGHTPGSVKYQLLVFLIVTCNTGLWHELRSLENCTWGIFVWQWM